MEYLRPVINDAEEWLMHRILRYASEQDYTRFTSTLVEAWRASIAGLSQALLASLPQGLSQPSPDEQYADDPAGAFAVTEARLHRRRGVNLTMFLGLMKYYRRAYCDLIREQTYPTERERLALDYVDLFFDRIELAFCEEWTSHSDNELLDELQARSRELTNEKNKYLTVFESLLDPVVLLDAEGRVDTFNHASLQLLHRPGRPGTVYYGEQLEEGLLDWVKEDVERCLGEADEAETDRVLATAAGTRHFHLKIKRMSDVSRKFAGTTIILSDVTAQRQADSLRDAAYRISEATHVAVGQEQLLDLIGPLVAAMLPGDTFALVLAEGDDLQYWNLESSESRLEARAGQHREFTCRQFPADEATKLVVKETHRQGRPMHVSSDQLAEWRREGVLADLPEWTECIAAPLFSWEGPDAAAGVLIGRLAQEGTAGYSEADLETLAFLATQVSTAIERQRGEAEREQLIQELREALSRVKTLSGLVPICARCKKIRDDRGFWNALEDFLQRHSEAEFSHGLCPECIEVLYPEYSDSAVQAEAESACRH